MLLEKIDYSEIINIIHEYIRENYEYSYADIFEDEIQYHLEDNKVVNVYVNLESECD